VVIPAGPLLHTTQLFGTDSAGKLVGSDARRQAEQAWKNLVKVLTDHGSSVNRLVKLNLYASTQENVTAAEAVLGEQLRGRVKPAICWMVGALPEAEQAIALDAVATVETRPSNSTESAKWMPSGARVYVSGQAERGKDLVEATRLTLLGLRKTLEWLDLNDGSVVQVKAFLNPMADAAIVRREIEAFFGDKLVPVVLVEWKFAQVEIELIASYGKDRSGDGIEYLTPPGLPASPIFCRVTRINRGPTIYLSGLYGSRADSPSAEVESLFEEMGKLLDEAKSDYRHLAKATYYVATDDVSKKLNEIRPKWYDKARPPAASKAMVTGSGRPDRSIVIDMIAVPKPE
jgi:enamine deaminase RidA (YjgF/YER057c/UK114 family)